MSILKRKNFLWLMSAIVIDVMSLGVIFPILPSLFSGENGLFLADHDAAQLHLFYGLVMASFPLGMIIGSPLLGYLSSRIGCSKVILVCFLGVGIAYSISLYSIMTLNVYLFIVSRFIGGFCAGIMAFIQALITQTFAVKDVKKYVGWTSVAYSLGIIVGPLLSSAMSVLFPDDGIILPFYILLSLSFIVLLKIVPILGKDDSVYLSGESISLRNSFFYLGTYKKEFLNYFMFQVGWGLFVMSLSLYLKAKYDFGQAGIGVVYAVSALGMIFSQLFTQDKVDKLLGDFEIIKWSVFSLSILILLFYFSSSVLMLFVFVFFISSIQILFSNAVVKIMTGSQRDSSKGIVLGLMSSVFGLAWCAAGLLISLFLSVDVTTPVLAAAIFLLIAFLGYSYKFYGRRVLNE